MILHQPVDRSAHLPGGEKPRALIGPVRSLMPRAGIEILQIEPEAAVVPAAVAEMIVDHPVGRMEFVEGKREAGDHHHGDSCCPGKPG